MSEIPSRLRDAITSHTIRPVPAQPRRLALWRGPDDRVAWRTAGSTAGWFRLPDAGEQAAGPEVARHVTPAGFAERWETAVVAVADRPAGTELRSADDVLAGWRAGERLLDTASRFAAGGSDELPGVEPAHGVRTVPLRTPTLPPATHTNLHLLDGGAGLIIDPGSPYPEEIERAVAACQAWTTHRRPLTGIFLTHHHGDHVGGAAALRDRLGLPILAHATTAALVGFDVDKEVRDGDVIGGWTALHTPGHAAGHVCLWQPERRLLIAGDMVASVGSIVVDPDEGDMAQYLDSLDRLRALDARAMFPAHGAVIDNPTHRLTSYTQHRLWRESRILAALSPEPQPLGAVTRGAYTDVSAAILWLAERSALAHLQKLEAEGRAFHVGAGWQAA